MMHEASLLELLQESRCSFCCLAIENIIHRLRFCKLVSGISFFEVINERDGMAAGGLFLEEGAEVYHDWQATEGTLQCVVLGLIHTPSRAAAMKAAEE